MTDIQKQDFQFWFYNRVFVDKLPIQDALFRASTEIHVSPAEGEAYLRSDGRLEEDTLTLKEYKRPSPDDRGEYLDFEWMAELLIHQAGLNGPELYRALGIIFKVTAEEAEELLSEASLTKDGEEGED